jgi:hypothetical protein
VPAAGVAAVATLEVIDRGKDEQPILVIEIFRREQGGWMFGVLFFCSRLVVPPS